MKRGEVTIIFALALGLGACGGGGGTANTAALSSSSLEQASASNVAASASLGCALDYDAEVKKVSRENDGNGVDPLYTTLWHLKNTGQKQGVPGEDLNIEGAWAITQGANVTIALVDDAVEAVHPDLQKNLDDSASLDYRNRAPRNAQAGRALPCDQSDYHGTAVAGIIGARYANGIGTVGVAPAAKMVAYGALDGADDTAAVDALNRGLQTNAIFNNSWGSPDSGELFEADAAFVNAIDVGLRAGRSGLGAVYVFPAGNGGCIYRNLQGKCDGELATYDGFLNSLGLIVVAGLDAYGKQPTYSERGANVLVSAPGGDSNNGITTTALTGKYTNYFVGTSASAPMVSGVAALMLSANPRLSWRDVRLILALSARRNDPSHPGWQMGASGLAFNPAYGFGAVDASAAVKMARDWKSVGGSDTLKQCTALVNSKTPVVDGAKATDIALAFEAGCEIEHIEHVEVMIDIDHPYSGDLDIVLTSPVNSRSELAKARTCNGSRLADECGAYNDWRFASVRHLNEVAKGQWVLSVKDAVLDTPKRTSGSDGSVNYVKLTVYGR